MNPKMTEFLAQDRISEFRKEAAGQHVQQRAAMTSPKAPDAPVPEHMTAIAFVWRRIRRAIVV